MADTQKWPVVGGVYKHRVHDVSARILAEENGEFPHQYVHASGKEGGMGFTCSGEVFRKQFLPEDQSPISALTAALRDYVERCRCGGSGLYSYNPDLVEAADCAECAQARAALALVEVAK